MIRQLDIFSSPSFHNTVSLKEKELELAERRAESLEAKVYELLKKSPRGLTKSDLRTIFGHQYGESSFGRSLTNLSRDISKGVYKSTEMRPGLNGVVNSVYKIKI